MKLPFTSATLLQQGPHIGIVISATRREVTEGKAAGLELPEWAVRALIVTGASQTLINPQIAATCKLKQTGRAKINAVGGEAGEYPEYAAAISFPDTGLPAIEAIRVVACPIIRQPFFSCLIGRDILSKWLVIYDGRTGQVEIQS